MYFWSNQMSLSTICEASHTRRYHAMKTLTRIALLTLLFTLLCGSCSTPHMEEQWNTIDGLMNDRPDSALTLLQAIDPKPLSRSDRAHHALLLSQAFDKNYIDLTGDSIINIAVDYYEKSNDTHRAMLALYYKGRVKYNNREYSAATKLFLQAEKLALQEKDYFYLGLIYRNIAYIYNIIFWGEGEIEYAQKAHAAFSKTTHQQHTNYAYFTLGSAHYNSKEYATARDIIVESMQRAIDTQDITLLVDSKRMLAHIYFSQDSFTIAKSIYDELDTNYAEQLAYDDYINMSLCQLYCGDEVKAFQYALNAAQLDSLETWGLYKIYKAQSNYKEALRCLENEVMQQNELLRGVLNQDVIGTVADFKAKEQQLQQQREQRIRYIWITLLIFVILTGSILFIRHIALKKREIETNISIAQNLQEILSCRNNECAEANSKIYQLLVSRFELVDQLCRTYYENPNASKVKTRISTIVEELIKEVSENKTTLQEWEDIINKNLSNLMTSFRKDLPDLKDSDYRLFLYSVLGYSTSAITIFLKEEKVEAIYNRRARLKKKIAQLNEEQKCIYLKYL